LCTLHGSCAIERWTDEIEAQGDTAIVPDKRVCINREILQARGKKRDRGEQLIVTMVALALLFALVGCSRSKGNAAEDAAAPAATDRLLVYSPNSDGLLNATTPAFEEKYDVDGEVISAGTGKLFKRLQGEANSPYMEASYS
jgi:hypothetical protein